MSNADGRTKAREIWEHISGMEKPFTADGIAELLMMNVATVRHYFSFWKDEGALRKVGQKEEEVGKRGRPRAEWECTTKDFVSVWRF